MVLGLPAANCAHHVRLSGSLAAGLIVYAGHSPITTAGCPQRNVLPFGIRLCIFTFLGFGMPCGGRPKWCQAKLGVRWTSLLLNSGLC